jgi:hypothetical protein
MGSAEPNKRWTAKEVRKLTQAERDAILAAAAQEAEAEYRGNRELTAFEALDNDPKLDALLEEGLNSGPPIQFTTEWWQQRKAELLRMLPRDT